MLGLLALSAVLLAACGGSPESAIAYGNVPPTGSVERGADLFDQPIRGMAACSSCHVEGATGAPSLEGYAEVAEERVEGQDAREYTFYAIAEPARHIVEGYGNAMPNQYDDRLAAQDMADLIAYLLEGD